MGFSASKEDIHALIGWFSKAADLLEHPIADSLNPYLVQELKGNPSANLFLNALLEGKRDFALSIVHSDEVQGFGLEEMYDRIFVPSQRELGRLWHLGKISVAQEHFVTAATQVIISSLYESFFKAHSSLGFSGGSGLSKKPVMIAACAQGELHELGIRMIADTFHARGWDTIFLGANVPEGDLLKEIRRTKPDFLSLSATISPHVAWIERAITEVRQIESPPKVLVGGRPFFTSPDLWRKVGADGTAKDCAHALAIAETILVSA
jgi:methanogenic corrinoid protein MtbC1